MANWTGATLNIFLPPENQQAFLDAIKGPQMWHIPRDAKPGFLSFSATERSAHDKMELLAERADLEARFRAHPARAGYPDWMPISMGDAEDLMADKLEPIEECMLSIPRLNPIKDRTEFDEIFPGTVADGYWSRADVPQKNPFQHLFTHWEDGLFYRKLGARSVLFDLQMLPLEAVSDGLVGMQFRFNIKNGAVTTFPQILMPLLEQYGAKALHAWAHNCESGGFDHMDPARGILASEQTDSETIAQHIGLSDGSESDEDDENDDMEDDYYIDWPEVLLWASQSAKDPDFDSIA